MSTICKLNPRVRQQRRERRATAAEFARLSDWRTARGQLVAETSQRLHNICQRPDRSGAQKGALFEWVLAGFEKQAEAMQTAGQW